MLASGKVECLHGARGGGVKEVLRAPAGGQVVVITAVLGGLYRPRPRGKGGADRGRAQLEVEVVAEVAGVDVHCEIKLFFRETEAREMLSMPIRISAF